MPRIPLVNEQYRSSIGNYTNLLDKKHGDQRVQNERVNALASKLGLHSGNRNRQNVAQALVQLASILSVVSNSTITHAKGIGNLQPTSIRLHSVGPELHNRVSTVRTLAPYEPVSLPVTTISPFTHTMQKSNRRTKNGINRAVKGEPIHNKTNKGIISFLKKKEVLDANAKTPLISKELLVSGAAHWIYDLNEEGDITPLHRMEGVARCILRGTGNYGSKASEQLSRQQIDKVVTIWMFDTILGGALNEYLTKKIAADTSSAPYNVGDIKRLLELETLNNKYFSIDNVPHEWKGDLNDMWSLSLKKVLPIIYFPERKLNTIAIDSEEFSHLYTGSRFLNEIMPTHDFNYDEVVHAGAAMWHIALSGGVNMDNFPYFLLPAMLFFAENKPEWINTEKNIRNISLDILNNYIEDRKKHLEIQQDIAEKLQSYKFAVDQYSHKGQLADKIIDGCPTHELPSFPDKADPIRTSEQRRDKAVRHAKQFYMNGLIKPCKTAPESLSQEYQRLTENVADGFREIDRYIISAALNSLGHDDRTFITSPEVTIYPVSFSMKTRRGMVTAYGVAKDIDTYVNLNKTDLFSVISDNEERIYALKEISTNNSIQYSCIHVNRDIQRYIDLDIIYRHEIGNNTVVENNKLKTDKGTFYFSMLTKMNSPYPKGNNGNVLIEKLSSVHRDALFQRLYKEGDNLSTIQNVWEKVKGFIPFYDCVSGIVNDDPVKAVPSCMLDSIAFIPILGQAAKMSGRFGMGMASGINKGSRVLHNGGQLAARKVFFREMVMPKASELNLLGKQTLSALDPGFELIGGLGKKFTTKLIDYLKKDHKTTEIAEKIISSGALERLPLPDSTIVSAHLPHSDVPIQVKKIGADAEQDIYVMVNADTGDVGGKHFHLQQGNQLEVISYDKLSKDDLALRKMLASEHVHDVVKNKDSEIVKGKIEVLFHNPRQRAGTSHAATYDDMVGYNVVADMPRLTSFLPPRADLYFVNKEYIEFINFQFRVIKHYFPHSYKNIIADGNALSRIHIQRVSDSMLLIPNEFSHLRNNFELHKLRLENAKHTVNNVMMKFEDLYHTQTPSVKNVDLRDNVVADYLKKVLGTESLDVLKHSTERLDQYLKRICNYFDDYQDKVYLASAKRDDITLSDSPSVLGFTNIKDSEKRVIIFSDCFDTGHGYNDDMLLTVVHEATHAELGTQDFFYSPYTNLVGEPEDIPEAFIEQLSDVDIDHPLNLDNEFLDAYAAHMGIERPSIESFKLMILNDDMLKANIILDNADSLSTIIIDLHERLFPPRMTRNARSLPLQSDSFDRRTLKALIGLIAAEAGAR